MQWWWCEYKREKYACCESTSGLAGGFSSQGGKMGGKPTCCKAFSPLSHPHASSAHKEEGTSWQVPLKGTAGQVWRAGTGCCLLAVLPVWFIHLSYLFVDFLAAFPGHPEPWHVAGHISTVACWLLSAPGSLSTSRHPGQSTRQWLHLLSYKHTFFSLLPVLIVHFSPLGNKAFLTSVTDNTQRAQKNFWVGGSLCYTAPSCRRLPRGALPVWAVHRM